MASLFRLVMAALLATLVGSAPTNPIDLSKRSFSIPVQRAHGYHKDPVQAMHRVAQKYGWEIEVFDGLANVIATITSFIPDLPPTGSYSQPTTSATGGVQPQPSPNATYTPPLDRPLAPTTTRAAPSPTASEGGEVSAIPEADDAEYLSPVTIGGQNFSLDFDTGSADLWVFSTYLPTSEHTGHSLFDPKKSKTWQPYANGEWQIRYGDGSGASGVVGFDEVDIGGATVPRQAIGLATEIHSSFLRDLNNDGLVGLAFSSINTITPQPQKTFFENVAPNLASPLFTADLEDDASGTYEFGVIDDTKYKGTLQYTPINKANGFWQFDSPSYTVGSQPYQCQICSPAIADTGTSLMMVDEDIAAAYYQAVPGAKLDQENGGYTFPCTASLPDFGVEMGESGFVAVLNGKEAVYKDLGGNVCFGGIQGNQGNGVQIYGDVFFKQYFAVFDGTEGAEKFGVALKDK